MDFDEKLNAHRPYLVMLAQMQFDRRLRARLDPSDIVQETLQEAHQQRELFRGDNSAQLAGWLRQMLRNNLIDQICEGTGGPCKYKGKTMMEAHQGMNITEAEFNALVGDLVAALDQFNVPDQEKNDLLGILGPMKSDIVGQ